MSMENIDKIDRSVREIIEQLLKIAMPFETAVTLNTSFNGIINLVKAVKEDHAEDRKELLDIIEGLLGNWPATEVIEYYKPKQGSFLQKKEAFRLATEVLENRK